jgi:hypothetical protein
MMSPLGLAGEFGRLTGHSRNIDMPSPIAGGDAREPRRTWQGTARPLDAKLKADSG